MLEALRRAVGDHSRIREDREEDRDLPRLAEMVCRSCPRRARPTIAAGIVAIAIAHDDPLVVASRIARVAHRPEPRRDVADDVVPEVDDDRDERAEVERDVEGLVERP